MVKMSSAYKLPPLSILNTSLVNLAKETKLCIDNTPNKPAQYSPLGAHVWVHAIVHLAPPPNT
jgi:hypothetical protein